jgi:hypothetical protein
MYTHNTLEKSLDLKANDKFVFADPFQNRKSNSMFRIQPHQASCGTNYRNPYRFPSWQMAPWQLLTMPNDLNSQVEFCVNDPPPEVIPVVDSF